MVKESTILLNGVPVYYRMEGKGQPVVLVHGFSEDGTVWENQVAALKDKCQLIIPDLPGSGRSAINDAQWSMEYFADCIRQVIDQEKIETVSMIGHSMGGYITLAFAEAWPNRLQSFGLFNSTAFCDM
jgi:pimeloyl-ACP methyl ester carboxylesterase